MTTKNLTKMRLDVNKNQCESIKHILCRFFDRRLLFATETIRER